jgi:hypothetical protein
VSDQFSNGSDKNDHSSAKQRETKRSTDGVIGGKNWKMSRVLRKESRGDTKDH